MQKKLKDFIAGEKGVVAFIEGDGRIRRRLFDMGVTPGAEIIMVKMAPLGDPIEVTIRGYQLSLRKSEAENVTMEMGE